MFIKSNMKLFLSDPSLFGSVLRILVYSDLLFSVFVPSSKRVLDPINTFVNFRFGFGLNMFGWVLVWIYGYR